ncbi:MAG: hypothetical protein VB031_01610 [Eubacteriaceae bacterium]|nr:hypothetical protein [Eubacteriaceae bacterium]
MNCATIYNQLKHIKPFTLGLDMAESPYWIKLNSIYEKVYSEYYINNISLDEMQSQKKEMHKIEMELYEYKTSRIKSGNICEYNESVLYNLWLLDDLNSTQALNDVPDDSVFFWNFNTPFTVLEFESYISWRTILRQRKDPEIYPCPFIIPYLKGLEYYIEGKTVLETWEKYSFLENLLEKNYESIIQSEVVTFSDKHRVNDARNKLRYVHDSMFKFGIFFNDDNPEINDFIVKQLYKMYPDEVIKERIAHFDFLDSYDFIREHTNGIARTKSVFYKSHLELIKTGFSELMKNTTVYLHDKGIDILDLWVGVKRKHSEHSSHLSFIINVPRFKEKSFLLYDGLVKIDLQHNGLFSNARTFIEDNKGRLVFNLRSTFEIPFLLLEKEIKNQLGIHARFKVKSDSMERTIKFNSLKKGDPIYDLYHIFLGKEYYTVVQESVKKAMSLQHITK